MDFGPFERVVVVNLTRRPERLERFCTHLGDWPFLRPERFDAIDGAKVPLPPQWERGVGAWGCLLSHLCIVDRALRDGVHSLFVLEDDAIPMAGFAQAALRFMDRVPPDWDGILFGAQHLLPPVHVTGGVVRCRCSNRTHAYAIRGRLIRELWNLWGNTLNDHCDIVLASTMPRFNIYAPEPLLIGQDAGPSDITGRNEPVRFVTLPAGHIPTAA
jgi:hypothetical protein